MFLEEFWGPLLLNNQSKNIFLFERLLEPVWSHVGRLLGCLWDSVGKPGMLSWHNPAADLAHFQKRRYSLSKLSWMTFGGHLGSFLPNFEPKMEPEITKKGPQKKVKF